jgi:tetratricopeptide (TPR) repeat protein
MAFVVSIFCFLFAIGLAGCSGTSGDSSNSGNANLSDVSEYQDAAQALADGTRFLDDDEVEKAIAALLQAVKLDPDLAEAYFNLGVAYALVEMRDSLDPERALPIGSNTDDTNKRPNSAIAFEKAAEAYERIIKREPENYQAHFSLGLSYNKLNKDREAARAFRQAVRLNPEDAQYQTELGKILIKLAEYREAIGPLKKALELDPENVEAEELLSDAEAGRSRVDYVSPKRDTNSASNSNTSANSSSAASNSDSRTDSKPTPNQTPVGTPRPAATRQQPPTNRPN